MYAIIASGGKQHRVTKNQTIKIEKVDAVAGAPVDFDKVLMVSDGDNLRVGSPYLAGAKVTGEIVEHGRGDKVHILKFRRRKHHLKRQGHRQDFTAVKINEIIAS